jgi:NADH:ubiquinone oxidoreductase subunit K
MIPLSWFLILAAVLFCIGLFTVLTRRNSIAILMGIELILSSSIINLVAFWRYLYADVPVMDGGMDGLVFALIIFVVAAAGTAVGLGLILSAYRLRQTIIVEEMDSLKG